MTPRVAIIGGTGLYDLKILEHIKDITIETPWGKPSGPISIVRTPGGHEVAFLARHGHGHEQLPSTVPFRANIAALKHLGIEAIVAFSSVGSLRGEIKPRDLVLPSQLIDRTKGVRANTFFDRGLVAHAGFAEPFDAGLRDFLRGYASVVEGEYDSMKSILHYPEAGDDLTVICIEGPAFSTRAESRLYRSWGGSVINMSVVPEAQLAREAEIDYQLVCLATDYDSWRVGHEPVTVEVVKASLAQNGRNAQRLIEASIDALADAVENRSLGQSTKGTMRGAITSSSIDESMRKKIEFLYPNK